MEKTCPKCQTRFNTKNSRRKCCIDCGRKFRPRNQEGFQERPFTEDTPFLCAKWFSEGMSVKRLALLLRRPEKQIMEAIFQYERPTTRQQADDGISDSP